MVLQAWLGSIVVSTNLMPWIITVHMLLALLIVAISIYTFYQATTLRNKTILSNQHVKGIKALAFVSLVLMVVQVVFGTEVRETIDHLSSQLVARQEWVANLGDSFSVHRVLAYVSLGLTVILFFLVRSRFSSLTLQSKYAWIVIVLIGIQMLSGIVLARFNVPAFAQTTHLVVASLLFGAQYYLMLLMTKLQR